MYSEKDTQRDCEDIKDPSVMEDEQPYGRSDKGKKAAWRDEDIEAEAMDSEQHFKKDCPPRFSTLFESKSAPAPVPIIQHYEEPPRRSRSGGVFLSWPTLILLGLLLFFETVAIFAYTAIGLYNNMPRNILTPGHTSTAALDVVGAGPAPVNFAPNINVGTGEHDTVTVTVTSTIYMPSPFGFQAAQQTQTTAENGMAALASDLRGLLRPSSTSSVNPAVTTITPGGGTATSVVFVTPSAAPQPTQERQTSFVTEFVAPSVLAAQQAAQANSKARDAAFAALGASPSAESTSSTTSSTSTSSSSTGAPAPTTTTNGGKGKTCFGGAGAVMLNCI